MSEPTYLCKLAAHETDVDRGDIMHPCPFCRIAGLEAALKDCADAVDAWNKWERSLWHGDPVQVGHADTAKLGVAALGRARAALKESLYLPEDALGEGKP